MKNWIMPLILSGLMTTWAGCTTTATQDGALLGGALGAGLGAVVGNQSGHAGEGALIGGAAGAITGAVVGDQYRKERRPVYRRDEDYRRADGHWETRVVRSPNGETFEERVFVPNY